MYFLCIVLLPVYIRRTGCTVFVLKVNCFVLIRTFCVLTVLLGYGNVIHQMSDARVFHGAGSESAEILGLFYERCDEDTETIDVFVKNIRLRTSAVFR